MSDAATGHNRDGTRARHSQGSPPARSPAACTGDLAATPTRWALELTGERVIMLVFAGEMDDVPASPLSREIAAWVARIHDACRRDHDGLPAARITSYRWIGERAEVEIYCHVSRTRRWWTPPEPPPAELMRYATRVEL